MTGDRRLDPPFRRDLFQGTASFYDRYRVPYPPALVSDLTRRIRADGNGRLLDVAAGTGQVSFPLAPYFREILAVDQEPDMVQLGAQKARARGLSHIRFQESAIETVSLPAQAFRLITVGNAFHRLPRDRMAVLMGQWLSPSGHVALLWSNNPWIGDRPWQHAVSAVVREWQRRLGSHSRVPAEWSAARAARPDSIVLAEQGFHRAGRFTFSCSHRWTTQDLAGYGYSMSVLSPAVMGQHREAFEADLGHAVVAHAAADEVSSDLSFAYELYAVRR